MSMLNNHLKPHITTRGRRIRGPRCQALSKRTKQQCMGPAVKGKNVYFEGKVFLIAGGEKSNTFQVGKIVCEKKGYIAHHGTSLNSK